MEPFDDATLFTIETMPHDYPAIKKKQEEFADTTKLKVATIWKHHRGGTYIIERLVMSEASEEMLIVYSSTRSAIERLPFSWTRPASEWEELVPSMEKAEDSSPTIKYVPRFTLHM